MRSILMVIGLALVNSSLVGAAELSACEAFSAADAVFIGEAGAPVRREMPAGKGSLTKSTFSPVVVERAFRGVFTPVVYVHPAGITKYLVPGQRYLVYGRAYAGRDMFMSTESYGTKPLDQARDDVEFLEATFASPPGAIISGVLELDESDATQIGRDVTPLANITIEFSGGPRPVATRTVAGGYFHIAGLPCGSYTASAQLPEDLMLGTDPPPIVRVSAGGCASIRLGARPNGHVRGVLTDEDGRHALGGHVALLRGDLKPGDADSYFDSVQVDRGGHFVFDGVRSGKYLLGRLGFVLNETPVPAIYYPGTPDQMAATVVVVDRSGTVDVGEFRVPRRNDR